jgi:WS/DGAT/MGAT family acyltransferase
VKQLSGLDASFLYMESPTTFGHVAGLAVYNRPAANFDPYHTVLHRFERMIGHAEPLRRKLVEVPLRLDHPYWIDDPDFDIHFHVRHLGLAPPGTPQQLGEQISRIISRPMDRTRPLWEVYVIEGIETGEWGLLTKLHHSTIAGASGVILLNMLTDATPDATFDLEPREWEGEEPPPASELVRRTVGSLVGNPLKAARINLRLAQNAADALGVTNVAGVVQRARQVVRAATGSAETAPDNERLVVMPVTPAPSTPWNDKITAHRRFATRPAHLHDIKELRVATGGTVNDIVMAVCAGALRNYLIGHGALPDKPLRAMVPVSIRTGDEADPWTNRVSGIVADLPTNLADPLHRLAACKAAMADAKRQFELLPATALTEIASTSPPLIATAATRLASRLAGRVNLPVNVVISNVPGPRQPLYLDGAQLQRYIPISIVTDGMGLNITVHSYLDQLDFGLTACRDLVPDLWDLVDLHVAEIAVLRAAAGVGGPAPARPRKTTTKTKGSQLTSRQAS